MAKSRGHAVTAAIASDAAGADDYRFRCVDHGCADSKAGSGLQLGLSKDSLR